MAANNNGYQFPIPASQPMADANAAGAALDAPAIAANSNRTIDDLTNCLRETKRRKTLKANPPTLTSVTSNEIAHSTLRQTAVAMELASETYGAAVGAPLWAQQMQANIAQQMQANIAQQTANIAQQMQANIAQQTANIAQQMQANIAQQTANIAGVSARLDNMEARRFNAAVAHNAELRPLRKVHPGHGNASPGTQVAAHGVEAPVGAVYPNFPANMNELMSMTRQDISRLAVWANETFGIQAGDTTIVRCHKFRSFVTGEHCSE